MKLTKGLSCFDDKRYVSMMEFLLWAIYTKLVSQAIIIKNIMIIEKDCDNWKRL